MLRSVGIYVNTHLPTGANTMQKNHDFFPKQKVAKASDFLEVRAYPVTGPKQGQVLKADYVTFAGILSSQIRINRVSAA